MSTLEQQVGRLLVDALGALDPYADGNWSSTVEDLTLAVRRSSTDPYASVEALVAAAVAVQQLLLSLAVRHGPPPTRDQVVEAASLLFAAPD